MKVPFKRFATNCCLLFACIVSVSNAGSDVLDYYTMGVLPSIRGSIGNTLWVHHLPEKSGYHIAGPLAVGKDGTIYYEAGGHGWNSTEWNPIQIYAVNKSDGSLKWKSEPLMTWHKNGNTILVGDNGNVYVASGTKLYSLNPFNGSVNWKWEVPHELPDPNDSERNVNTYGELGYMVLANSNDIIIKTMGSGSYYRAMYCISSNTGSIKWYQFIPSNITHISIGKNGMIYAFSSINGTPVLTSRSPDTGGLNWSIPIESTGAGDNIAFTKNGDLVLMTRKDGMNLVRINPANQQFVWKKHIDAPRSDYKFIAPNGNIYVNNWTGWYIYNSDNGDIINSDLHISSQPFNYDARNHIIGTINDNESIMHVTDNVGNELWKTNSGVDASSIIASGNVIYFYALDKDGKDAIFALRTDAGLVHAGWPRFSHDNRNTFNFNKW